MKKMIRELQKLDVGEIIEDIDLKKYTTYRLNLKAKVLVKPKSTKQLINVITYALENNIKYKIIGFGANLIFKDDYEGILIKLDAFNYIEKIDNFVIVGSGYSLPLLATSLSNEGYSGLEFAVGIPSTIGGAIFNNAGAYKSDMSNIVKSVLVLTPSLEIKRLSNEDLKFAYRTSFLKENPGYIVLEAIIALMKGNKDVIEEVIESRKKRRIASQPLEYPSAGSVFRNPEGKFVGKLIEDLGYKGKMVGGAKVSEKHANFIINTGNATGQDIIDLIDEIKKEVKEVYKEDLILEQEIVK